MSQFPWASLFMLGLSLGPFFANGAEAPDDNKFQDRSFTSYMKELLEYDEPTKYRVPGVPFSMTWINSQSTGRHILVGCRLQGRQLGCLPALIDLFREFQTGKLGSFQGRITFFVANPEAAVKPNSNVASEENLNFAAHSPAGLAKDRADELKKLMEGVDLFIDLSQRQDASGRSFYSFPYEEVTYDWARYLNASDTLVIPADTVSAKTMSLTEFARRKGIPSISLEIAVKDRGPEALKSAYDLARKTVQRALAARSRISSMREIYGLSEATPDLKNFYRTTWVQPFTSPMAKLVGEFTNFQAVAKDTVVGLDGTTEIKAPAAGFMLHPRYPQRDDTQASKEPLPPYLFQFLEVITRKTLTD